MVYAAKSPTFICVDINECLSGNNGGCDHICLNFVGSSNCSCRVGFSLNVDGTTCTGINTAVHVQL